MSDYLALTCQWKAGDMIDYTMHMPVQAIFANPAVRQLQGRVAIQRGPIIYCIEGIDHNQMILDRISINPTDIASFTAKYRPDLLGGVAVIHGVGMCIEDADWQRELYRSDIPRKTAIQLTAVPFCVWDNREPGEMRVWLRAD